jgi:hypothetical protein
MCRDRHSRPQGGSHRAVRDHLFLVGDMVVVGDLDDCGPDRRIPDPGVDLMTFTSAVAAGSATSSGARPRSAIVMVNSRWPVGTRHSLNHPDVVPANTSIASLYRRSQNEGEGS